MNDGTPYFPLHCTYIFLNNDVFCEDRGYACYSSFCFQYLANIWHWITSVIIADTSVTHFTHIHSLILCNNPRREVLLLSLFCRWESRITGRLRTCQGCTTRKYQSWDWKPGRSKSRVSTLNHYAILPFSVNVYGLDEAKWIGRLVLGQLLVFLYMGNLSFLFLSSLSQEHYTYYKSQLGYLLLQEASLISPVRYPSVDLR